MSDSPSVDTTEVPASSKPSIQPLRPTGRRVAMVIALTVLWCGLWREASVANIASGLLLSIAVLGVGIGAPTTGTLRIRPLLRLIALVLVDLATSTVGVAREVLGPADTTDEAIIAVQVGEEARRHLLLLVIAVTLTPGTAVVDANPSTGMLYLHLLHVDRRADVERHVHRLAEVAGDALPSDRTNPFLPYRSTRPRRRRP